MRSKEVDLRGAARAAVRGDLSVGGPWIEHLGRVEGVVGRDQLQRGMR